MTDAEISTAGQELVLSLCRQTVDYLKTMKLNECSKDVIIHHIFTAMAVYVDTICEKITINSEDKLKLIKIFSMTLAEGAVEFEKRKENNYV